MKRNRWPFNTSVCSIVVTAWTGLAYTCIYIFYNQEITKFNKLIHCISILLKLDAFCIFFFHWHLPTSRLGVRTNVISAYHHKCCEFESCSWQDVLDTTLCDKDCQFSQGTPVSFTNKTCCHNITDILLKVVLDTITQTLGRLASCHANISFI